MNYLTYKPTPNGKKWNSKQEMRWCLLQIPIEYQLEYQPSRLLFKAIGIRALMVLFFCFTIFYGSAQEIQLSPQRVQEFQHKVSAVAQKSTTIVNTFIQLKHIDFLTNDVESKGKLYFKAPNTIKWSYTEPYPYSVIFKNQKLYINDDGKKSDVNLASNKLFQKLNDLIAKSVSGDLLDKTQFDITVIRNKGLHIAHLIPKDQVLQEMFSTIVLTFSGDMLVTAVKLIEPSGDYTFIMFETTSINQPIPDAIFAH